MDHGGSAASRSAREMRTAPYPRASHTEHTPRSLTLGIAVALSGVIYLCALPVFSAVEANTRPGASITLSSLRDHGLWASAWWIALAAVFLQAALLVWIRRAPLHTLAAIAATAAVASALAQAEPAQATLLAAIPAAYIAARHHTRARQLATARQPSDRRQPSAVRQSPAAWWAATAALVWVARTVSALPDPDFSPALAVAAGAGQAALGVGLPALVGVVLRGRADMHAARERELIARADEQEARTEAALAAERTAIARELHDIAAHHLSGIAIMASAISQQVDTDPAAAKASLKDVRTQTRTLLDELRGLVTLLRSDEGATVAVESLAGVETLVDSAHLRGQAVTLTLAPAPDTAGAPPGTTADAPLTHATALASLAAGIGPLSQFAAYRTIQEALANAARHAPGAPCDVTLTGTPRALEIEIINARAHPANGPAQAHAASHADSTTTTHTGFGLRGMQERAALTKSRLTYGPTDDGGWRVALAVPREESR